MEIHIQRDGQQMGPYTLEQINECLVQGALLATDSAWHEGLPQWVPLNEIAGVVSDQAVTSTPPPFKPPATMAPKKTGATIEIPRLWVIGAGAVVLAVVVLVVVVLWGTFFPHPTIPNSETTQPTQGINQTSKVKIGTPIWEFKTGAAIVFSSPAIGSDGTVYVGSQDGKLYAINGKSGVKLWEFKTTHVVDSSPAIGSDGTVYVGAGVLYAINGKSGVKLWEFVTGSAVSSSPAIGSDGTVYVGSYDNKLYAINGKSGVKLWEYVTRGTVESSPAIGSDGTVYVGSDDKKLYAINGKSGIKLWEFETGGKVVSSPAIGSDGTVYVGSNDNKLYAINGKSGVKLWEFRTGGAVKSSPAIGPDGTVYVGSFDKKLYAINGKSGVKLWEFVTGRYVFSSPAIGSDGTVYVGSDVLYAINGKSGVKLWEFETWRGVNSSPAIGSDGTVYVGAEDWKLYAIKTESKGLAKSPWPMRGQNAEHTGRAPNSKNEEPTPPVTPPPTGTFVNTLGMKFVSVPGTDVQFSIWETRVKDYAAYAAYYAAYAAANAGVDESWKNFGGFKQEDTHPVVNVNWNEAQAFCEWLTKKELAEGKIKAGQKYRLPTDAEWSVAVGLGQEKGNTPKERKMGIEGVYPWGNQWPPPKGAGNYNGSLNVDNYEKTSPAGSFGANKLGLHDMGGNVWEWCEDWYDPAAKAHRVLRGASWGIIYPGGLLSSYRNFFTPGGRSIGIGFRCVLVGGSGG
jgi:outer membrane protein assembly factor BamB